MTRTGPNDARQIVWAISEFFYYFFRVFYILNNVLECIQIVIYEVRDGRLATTRKGPNDARRVV